MRLARARTFLILAIATLLLLGAQGLPSAHAWNTSGTQDCNEGDATHTWTNTARVDGKFAPGLSRYGVLSTCTTKYQIASLNTATQYIVIMIAPGADRQVKRSGLQHLGLWELPVTGVGSGGAGYLTPCPDIHPNTVNYLFEANGKIKVNPCA